MQKIAFLAYAYTAHFANPVTMFDIYGLCASDYSASLEQFHRMGMDEVQYQSSIYKKVTSYRFPYGEIIDYDFIPESSGMPAYIRHKLNADVAANTFTYNTIVYLANDVNGVVNLGLDLTFNYNNTVSDIKTGVAGSIKNTVDYVSNTPVEKQFTEFIDAQIRGIQDPHSWERALSLNVEIFAGAGLSKIKKPVMRPVKTSPKPVSVLDDAVEQGAKAGVGESGIKDILSGLKSGKSSGVKIVDSTDELSSIFVTI